MGPVGGLDVLSAREILNQFSSVHPKRNLRCLTAVYEIMSVISIISFNLKAN
jgi:hypothetical protein